MTTNNKGTVSLVLGSGGARGLAHIGVIRWLEVNNFKIESISGCSMGALIGGIYATGKLDVYEQWACALTKVDIFTLLDFSWNKNGFIKGDKIIATLIDLVGDQLIEELPISYTAVATDIKNEKEVWMKSGRLFDAIRASISMPLFFTPFNYNGIDLIDGCVLNPVPIAPTFGDKTEMTIAVNLGGAIEIKETKDEVTTLPETYSSALRENINRYITKFQQLTKKSSKLDRNMYDIVDQAFDTMQSAIAKQKLAAYPPDITIEIARNACGLLEFYRASEVIERGYRCAGNCLGHLVK